MAANTSLPARGARTLVGLIAEQAARTPHAVAVVAADEMLTYAELMARADRLAGRLRAIGVAPEVVVGVCAERGVALVVGLLGVLRAGGAYLPLDPEYPPDRLSYLLTDVGADVVLAHGPTRDRVRALGCESIVDIEADVPPTGLAPVDVDPANLAYVIYTSGSTGRPKGACLAHAGVVNRLQWMQDAHPIGPADAVLQKTPVSFDDSVCELFWPLLTGARLVMARPGGHRDAGYLASVIREHGITVMHFVPSMLTQFLDEPAAAGLTSLRFVICSGEALPVDLAERAMALLPGSVENLYGPTEASIDVSAYRCRPGMVNSVPIGRPVANTGLYVLTPDLELTADGEPGELFVSGIQLARGYHGRGGLTAERFVPNPFGDGDRLYRTGDIARWRPDGELEYLGRTDDQVKINGFRIELDEIAVALRAHPDLRDAVVVPHAGVAGHQQLVGYLVPAADTVPTPADLRAFLGRTLPAYMAPALYVSIDEIPLSLNGKIDRKRLPAPARSTAAPATVAGTDTERRLVEVWSTAFGPVGVDDDFLDLGGDSIVALALVTKARAAGLRIGVEHVLRRRTIRAIAETAEIIVPVEATDVPTDAVVPEGRDADLVRGLRESADVEQVHPLTPLQAGMLFHSLYQDDSTEYFQQTVTRVTGPFSPELCRAAWHDVAVRHAALRSRVHWADLDRPVQVVERAVRTPIATLDLRDDPSALEEFLVDDRAAGFDPAAAPPLRLTLARVDDAEWAVVISHHHLLLDGWSMSLVLRELMALCKATLTGEPAHLPPAPQFRRYVDWIDRQDRTRSETFWRDRLSGRPGRMSLVQRRSRPRAAQGAADLSLTLPAGPLRDRARREGLTLNSVVHGLWGLLLATCGERSDDGGCDVQFGATLSGRPPELSDVDATVGLFISTLPVRLTVDPTAGLAEWLRGVQWSLLALQPHQHCAVSDIRAWSGTPADQPLFDTIVVGQNQPAPDGTDPVTGLSFRSHDTVTNTGYPMVVLVEEHGDTVELVLRYQTALFEGAAVRRIADQLELSLTAFTTDPDQLVGELPLTTAADRASWPVFGDDVPTPDATVHELVEAAARRTPDAIAVRCAGRTLTFAELNGRANKLAHHLRERGVGPDVLVGVCARRSPELLVALLGVLKAGGAYVPLAPDNPRERLRTIVEDTGLTRVVVEDELRGMIEAAELIPPDAGTVTTDPVPLATPDNLAYVIFTSGSTGRPKGVAVPHRGVVNHLHWFLGLLPPDARGGAPVFSSYGFDLAAPLIYGPLSAGQTVHLLPDGLDAGELADHLAAGGPYAIVKLTPGLLELLAEHVDPQRARDLTRVLLVGGEPFTATLLAKWRRLAPDTAIVNHYGPTEVTIGCSSCRADTREPDTALVPLGRPHRNQSMYVLDEQLRPVPIGVPGEIYVGGIGTSRGYLGRPAPTATRFLPDPFSPLPGRRMYRTGDRACRLPSGDLYFLGRSDDQVKIRGYRVELGEIEQVLARHPGLHAAAVAAPVDEGGRPRLVGYAVAASPDAPTDAQLREWLGGRLPQYMVPTRYVFLDALPLTANGKLDRRALPAPTAAADRAAASDYVEPNGAVERTLAAAWAHVLRVARVGAHENFFELGGDSIMTLQIVTQARRAGLKISPKLIFQHPTVARLAGHATPIAAAGPIRRSAPTGEWFGVSPIQRAFLERELPHHNHYNQAVVLELTDADPARLAAALGRVVAHHAALRTRFDLGPTGPRQRVADREDAELLWCRDVPAGDEDALTAAAEQVQASLDITAGPLLRAGLLRTGAARDTLVVAVHHLVVDTLSWRPLIEDLAAAYDGNGLPELSSSYQDFVRSLRGAVPLVPPRTRPLPYDHDLGPDTVGSAGALVVRLSEQDTTRLLRDAPRVHRVRAEDLVITAAAATLTDWLGGPAELDVERHGRDDEPQELDLSRTVGWFTQVIPMRIVEPDLHLVKEQLRALPSAADQVRPAAPVVVNYHGRVDRSIPDVGPFTVAGAPLGSDQDPAYPRTRPIEIEAGVRDGVLQVEWIYPTTRLRADTVRRLADAFVDHLRALTTFCVEHPGGWTPSDFPLAQLTQKEVDHLTAGGDTTDIYPLTPMQEGLLFHSLLDPDDDMYLGRRTYRLTGTVDPAVFARAWREVGRRHPLLRSTIVWDGVAEPVQVVHEADLRVVDAVRTGGFDLAAAPAFEVALVSDGDGDCLRVVLSYHHILVDGWSFATILTEVMDIYHALLAGSADRPAPAPQFRQFVSWLRESDRTADDRYWRATLGDVERPTPLALTPPVTADHGAAYADVALSDELSAAVRRCATTAGLTLATLAQGAWATVLADRTGCADVLFGATVAIRPGELSDVDRMVGPLINTVPVRVRVERDRDARAWLTELQSRHAELREHAAVSLPDLHRATRVPAGQPLFENILVVENFPQPVIAGPAASLSTVHEWERTGYPLVIGVIDTNPITVQVLYERSACAPEFAATLAADLVAAFDRLCPRS